MRGKTVYTITLNPAWDRTAAVGRLVLGGTHLLRAVREDAGGKGINVSRVLHAMEKDTEALGLLGGGAGDSLLKRLQEEGIRCDFIRLPGACRTNTKIVDTAAGVTTEFNEAGPEVSAEHLQALERRLESLDAKTAAVFAGSLPPGVPPDWYARAVRLCRKAGVRVVLDASGEGLRQGLLGAPEVVKPNREELQTLCGAVLPDTDSLICAARRQLLGKGIGLAAVSLGADGALFITPFAAVQAMPPRVQAKSTVGAGDTMTAVLADWLAERQEQTALPDAEQLCVLARSAVAAASAKVLREGTQPPRAEEIAAIAEKVECRVVDQNS